MRSNKATLNIRIRRLRNVILRAKHSVRRYRQDVTRTQWEIDRIEQLQRVIAKGYFAAGTVLYPKPGGGNG